MAILSNRLRQQEATKYLQERLIIHRDIKPENLLYRSVWDVRLRDMYQINTYLQYRVPTVIRRTSCSATLD